MTMDVTDRKQIDAAMGRIVEEYGRLDVLVNNAGVNTLKHRATIDEFPREEWDRVFAVDLTGLYEVSQAAASSCASSNRGASSTSLRWSAWFPCGCNSPLRLQRPEWST